mmetsp:Transcript_11798/g.13598  ORF Transcript_11798/g.13598 Transcript_11798/m.13598 type:complete len:363 (-) Transcript_11798:162-1250(-)
MAGNEFFKYFILAGTVSAWQAMGMLLTEVTEHYPKYYFVSWSAHSWYILAIPVWLFLNHRYRGKSLSDSFTEINRYDIQLYAAIASIISLLAAVLWYYSLPLTILSANNAVYQSSPFFVFILSVTFLGESVKVKKIIGLCFCFAGVLMISLYTKDQTKSDGTTQKSTVRGYLLTLMSALFAGVFEVFNEWISHKKKPHHGLISPEEAFRYEGGHERPASSEESNATKVIESIRFLGLIGFYNCFLLWPGIFIVTATGVEGEFNLPAHSVLVKLLIASSIEACYVALLISGIAISSSTFMAVGQMLIIPMGYMVEIFFEGEHLSDHAWQNYLGAMLIITGFLTMQESTNQTRYENVSQQENGP